MTKINLVMLEIYMVYLVLAGFKCNWQECFFITRKLVGFNSKHSNVLIRVLDCLS